MQSLLALAALAVVIVLSLTVQRSRHGIETRQMSNETNTVALGVATEWLNRASLLPFDAVGRVQSVADLTPASGFGGAATWADVTDLDDLDAMDVAQTVNAPTGELRFRVRASVRYVRLGPAGAEPSPVSTPHKEMTVLVENGAGQRVSLSRLYGCLFNA